jgi:hypothetical protein
MNYRSLPRCWIADRGKGNLPIFASFTASVTRRLVTAPADAPVTGRCPIWSRAGVRNCHYWDVPCRSWQEVRVAGESRSGWLAGLAPGAVLAGYRLEARIGAGGMAVVFRATDERLGRTVAGLVRPAPLTGVPGCVM